MSRRRAFTVLEVMVASALASIVLIAALALFGFMDRSNARQQQRFENLGELAILHQTVRRAMQTLVAEPTPPGQRSAAAGTAPGDPAAQDDAETDEDDADVQARLERDADEGGDANGVREVDARGRRIARQPRFLLQPQIDGVADAGAPRRLEVVLLAQPAPGPEPETPTIRGAFEIVPQVRGLGILWRPINPPGDPVLLASDLHAVRWSALARASVESRYDPDSGAWRLDAAGGYIAEFPKAVRLEVVTRAGDEFDWLFELAITSGPEP
ncbi:MAG: type II secretion system protein [Phycisphaerales bacterium]|nr:MAG: type II secretion system protein [Phycisphaerales bacterium]